MEPKSSCESWAVCFWLAPTPAPPSKGGVRTRGLAPTLGHPAKEVENARFGTHPWTSRKGGVENARFGTYPCPSRKGR
jgi:hypothetical protein